MSGHSPLLYNYRMKAPASIILAGVNLLYISEDAGKCCASADKLNEVWYASSG